MESLPYGEEEFSSTRSNERGVALVITLVLLVIITTLALAFLAISHRETSAVTSTISTTDAEHAAQAGLARADAQILAPFFANNAVLPAPGLPIAPQRDLMGPDLMVSLARDTNFPGPSGLFVDPGPPVRVWTNKAINNVSAVDDRFYLDLNRNGRFEPTGFVPNTNDLGAPVLDATGNPVIEWRVGDPHWIGILRDPMRQHGPDNHFIARYAFLILPAGRTLDLNWIHNQAIPRGVSTDWTRDNYFRNQGVGSYEMNLAAFLADVNSNYWNNAVTGVRYQYQPIPDPILGSSIGDAFADAREFLYYRFDRDKQNPAPANLLFASLGPLNLNYFPIDNIDACANGPVGSLGASLLTIPTAETDLRWEDNPARSWPGGGSRLHFYTIHDLWNRVKLTNWTGAPGFVARLNAASARVNSEDRYTYSRILAQIGTDSPAERDDRLNINYRNMTNVYDTPFTVRVPISTNSASYTNFSQGGMATNFVPWTATEFFHAAADRLLTNEFFPVGVTNIGLLEGRTIPVYVLNTSNQYSAFGYPITNRYIPSSYPAYSPRIHQILQVVANIHEATLPLDPDPLSTNLPTVYRPIFARRKAGEVHIVRYEDETTKDFKALAAATGPLKWYELSESGRVLGQSASGGENPTVNFFDIPILFGARKGLPNFNEFTMNTVASFSRKVQVRKNPNGVGIASTEQMLIMSLTNLMIAELWNSYSNYPNAQFAYPRALELSVGVVSRVILTNNNGFRVSTNIANGASPTYAALTWSNDYRLTPTLTNAVLQPSIFYSSAPFGPGFRAFDTVSPGNNQFEVIGIGSTNNWGVQVSNRFLCFLFDNGRLVDSFTSARMNSHFDLSRTLADVTRGSPSEFLRMWDPTRGLQQQLDSSGAVNPTVPPSGTEWLSYQDLPSGYNTILAAKQGFNYFLNNDTPTQLVFQAGFTPNIRMFQASSWEANDPLVHYTALDLYGGTAATNVLASRLLPTDTSYSIYSNAATALRVSSPGKRNTRYDAWGGNAPENIALDSTDPAPFQLAEKDSSVTRPDDWDFPTQKLPNLGWIGRVHRGTPWQTIYLKSYDPVYDDPADPAMDRWARHTGAAFMQQTFPTNDWRLLDLFTAAIHPNATRGRLSINQTNVAAWSAVFTGVRTTTLTNDGGPFYWREESILEPASSDYPTMGLNAPLLRLVEGINRKRRDSARAPFTNNFTRLSDFMSVPELTLASPFLPSDIGIRQGPVSRATDSDYERLPQQILSLVKLGEPRYVVYAWGQSLKPADYVPGIGVGIDPSSKLVRNYQITGEVATRAVVRVEFDGDVTWIGALGWRPDRTDFRRPHAVVESFNVLPNE